MLTVFLAIGAVGLALLVISLVVGEIHGGLFEWIDNDLFSGAAVSAFLSALGFVGAGVTHQGVAVADVEVDVGQRLQFMPGVHLRHQLEEETQLTDFDRFSHDVYAEEVVQDDVLVNKVAARMMVPYFIQNFDEVGFARLAEFFRILDETFHAVEAGFVERFQHVERSKKKSA